MINLIAFIGPSAVGKSTLRDLLGFERIITYTSRPPRENELDGVDYHFTTKDHILKMHEESSLLEFTEYNGNYYATSFSSVDDLVISNRCSTIIVDYNGAKKIKQEFKESVLIIGVEASLEECKARMESRKEKNIKMRLASFSKEVELLQSISDITINNSEEKWDNSSQIMTILETGIRNENVDTLSIIIKHSQ